MGCGGEGGWEEPSTSRIGDFNEVLHRSEHVGVEERSHAQIEAFREVVDVCEL